VNKFATFLVGVAVGLAAYYIAAPRAAAPDLSGPASVFHLADPGADPVRLTVHRVVLDGRGETPREPAGRDTWRIDLAGGRVVLFASATPGSR
jgi:hypothetical protein